MPQGLKKTFIHKVMAQLGSNNILDYKWSQLRDSSKIVGYARKMHSKRCSIIRGAGKIATRICLQRIISKHGSLK
jgi:hypothetical protein